MLTQTQQSEAQVDVSCESELYARSSEFLGERQGLFAKLPRPLEVSLQECRVPEVGEHYPDVIWISYSPGQLKAFLPQSCPLSVVVLLVDRQVSQQVERMKPLERRGGVSFLLQFPEYFHILL